MASINDSISHLSEWTPCDGSLKCACQNHVIPDFQPTSMPPLRENPVIHHLTRTNNAPSPAEEDMLEAMILELQSRLDAAESFSVQVKKLRAEVMTQVQRIDTLLRTLDTEHATLVKAIEERKALLGPVRRLPSEILSRIFSLTNDFPIRTKIKDDIEKDSNNWRELLPAENMLLTIELVCRSWRRELLQSPSLWARINVSIKATDSDADLEIATLRLATQLSRVGLSDLSVGLYCYSTEAYHPHQLSSLLLPFAPRIRDLVLHMPPSMLCTLSPFYDRFRGLKNLDFIWVHVGQPWHGRCVLFMTCPELQSVSFSDVDHALACFALPWATIRNFTSEHVYLPKHSDYTGPEPLSVLQVLKAGRHLRVCNIRMEFCSVVEPPELQGLLVTCPQLLEMSIRIWPFANTRPVPQLLNHLSAPALSKLTIETGLRTGGRDEETTFASIVHFIERSQSRLSALHFSKGRLSSDDILRFLHLTPTLEDLRLADCEGMKNEVLDALIFKHDSREILVPRLEKLHLSGSLVFDEKVFTNMVKSRWQTTPLRSLNLGWYTEGVRESSAREYVIAELMPYCAGGLNLVTSVG
ncbi:hypothetical protein BDZ89DRAFT_1067947 [Hymenopellis radicata]|nr:hypothetical protein BDZ89DRAFT_1067947 [Hymenopellis radicata]